MDPQLRIIEEDNLIWLRKSLPQQYDLIYIDPPFNTGKIQKIRGKSYEDRFPDYRTFIRPYFEFVKLILVPDGSFFFNIDYRESHYCKILLDEIFGRECFMNEIIWSYDYGGRPKNKWPPKHDTIFWYVMDPKNYTFNYDEIDRIPYPYMAPSLIGTEKAKRVDYPTQKPLSILSRIVRVHSKPGDYLLDFFAGSGSFGEAAIRNGRNCTLVDINPDAIKVIRERFERINPECPHRVRTCWSCTELVHHGLEKRMIVKTERKGKDCAKDN